MRAGQDEPIVQTGRSRCRNRIGRVTRLIRGVRARVWKICFAPGRVCEQRARHLLRGGEEEDEAGTAPVLLRFPPGARVAEKLYVGRADGRDGQARQARVDQYPGEARASHDARTRRPSLKVPSPYLSFSYPRSLEGSFFLGHIMTFDNANANGDTNGLESKLGEWAL